MYINIKFMRFYIFHIDNSPIVFLVGAAVAPASTQWQ